MSTIETINASTEKTIARTRAVVNGLRNLLKGDIQIDCTINVF